MGMAVAVERSWVTVFESVMTELRRVHFLRVPVLEDVIVTMVLL
jgi:hypothetical protein